MNRTDARLLAETIKNHELLQMFENARLQIKDWSAKSVLNKRVSKRTAMKMLCGAMFNTSKNYHVIAKANMIREFGEYLPGYLLLPKENK